MKTKINVQFFIVCPLLATTWQMVLAQGTVFTYQGRLNSGGNPASGIYDLRFALYDAVTNGTQQGNSVTNPATIISNGLFTVMLDFGNQFPGAARWLEIAVRTNGGTGFVTLLPRQPLTPAPYAAFAEASGGVASSGSQPVTLSANGTNLLQAQLAYDVGFAAYTANLSGGSPANLISSGVIGGFIGGGGNTLYPNLVEGNYGSVLGGFANLASGSGSTAMGAYNTASGGYSTAMGEGNTASGAYSTAMGQQANAVHDGSFVWADSQAPVFNSTANDQFSVRAQSGVRLVGDVTTGDISLSENGPYHRLSMSGGNSTGFLYGSYAGLGDGIHLGYNCYFSSSGAGVVINPGGATSRISVGYGQIVLAVGGVDSLPLTTMLQVTTSGVCANGAVGNCSDRNVKQDFAPVSPAQILEKVLQLPVSEWSYKIDSATRHIGPMAQDFYAAFKVGSDDRHITTVDEEGVALAAIQGLNGRFESGKAETETRVRHLEERLEQKDEEVTELKAMVAELKLMIKAMNRN